MNDVKPDSGRMAALSRFQIGKYFPEVGTYKHYLNDAVYHQLIKTNEEYHALMRLFENASVQQRMALVAMLRAAWVTGFEAGTDKST